MTNTINANKRPDFISKQFADLNAQRIISIALPFLSLHSKTARISSLAIGAYQLYNANTWSDRALLVSSTALGYFCPLGQLALSSSAVLYKCYQDPELKSLLQVTSQAIHIASIYYGTPAWIVASLLSQATGELIQSYKEYQESKTPEMIAALLLAGLRVHKACSYLPKELPALKSNTSLAREIDVDLSGDLEDKIDARRFMMVDADNQEHDFGSYFHGYGKNLVKGANLHFKKVEKGIELSFRINHIYHQRLRRMINAFNELKLVEQEDVVHLLLNQRIKPDSQHGFYKGDMVVFDKLGTLNFVKNEDVYNSKDQVKVTLPQGATLESFKHFLSHFGLQDALERSSDEDIERIKIGILFRTFFPSKAYETEKDDSFFTLPLNKLKQRIVWVAPQMEEHFKQESIEARELFPGYVKYGVAIDKKAYALGARALTTSLTSLGNANTQKSLDQIATILKIGLLSQEMREKNGINAKGLNFPYHYIVGGAQSIYTQMITTSDLLKQKRLSSFPYTSFMTSPIRLYLSLDTLNQGSYQFIDGRCGSRVTDQYISRPTITQFVQSNPSMNPMHEIMLPDRVRPEYIKAMSVQSQLFKELIITHLRKCNLIHNEKINGIPVDEFIRTEDHITPDIVKHCHPSSKAAG